MPAPGAELDEAAAELLGDVLEEAGAAVAVERVWRLKAFNKLALPWRAASASALRFFSALAAVIVVLCFEPRGLPLRILLLSYCSHRRHRSRAIKRDLSSVIHMRL